MFTGIVEGTGRIAAVSGRETVRLTVEAPEPWGDVRVGASVAVDGVCLTVAACETERLAFDVIPETLRRTTLGERRPGERLNLERAMRLGDRVDGHLVQGHIDRTGILMGVRREGGDVVLTVRAEGDAPAGWIGKGSITVDGVSLTVARVQGLEFDVCLVPETLRRTTLGGHAPGRRVNLESDMLGQWVRHWMAYGRA
ncbi:MAG: riboflavin synthase [Planctomycetes bacterium]|nr:riboflavin synthase [Planctomycetota bacterium]